MNYYRCSINKKTSHGFTLMEMLIVVAIIAVLVAIAIPTFSGALEKAREATDLANIRGAYSEISIKALTESPEEIQPITVVLAGKVDGWQSVDGSGILSGLGTVIGTPQKGGSCEIGWQDNKAVFNFKGRLPVTFSETDLANQVVMAEKYGQIVSYLVKNDLKNDSRNMKNIYQRDGYYGEGETNEDKILIITAQTRDGQTTQEIKDMMKQIGYSDKEVEDIYTGLRYAYLDESGNLLGYHGGSSGGQTQLYIVGNNANPVSTGGAEDAKAKIAEYILSNSNNKN